MVFSVGLLIEKDDLIVSNWTVRGTHTGTAFYDVEPSGEPVEINGTAILRMRDGKIVKAFAFFDSTEFNELWTRVSPDSSR